MFMIRCRRNVEIDAKPFYDVNISTFTDVRSVKSVTNEPLNNSRIFLAVPQTDVLPNGPAAGLGKAIE